MNFTKQFFLVVLIVIATSCDTTRYPNEVGELDDLIKSVEKSSTNLVKVDTTGLGEKWATYKNNVNTITDFYKERNDTIGPELAMILSEYKQIKKPYSEYKDAYTEALTELRFSKNQLVTLKHDLEKNLLEPEIAAKMMESERTATNRIIEHVKQLVRTDSVTRMKEVYLTARIDSVIASLNIEE